jgi:hypothetical protein
MQTTAVASSGGISNGDISGIVTGVVIIAVVGMSFVYLYKMKVWHHSRSRILGDNPDSSLQMQNASFGGQMRRARTRYDNVNEDSILQSDE